MSSRSTELALPPPYTLARHETFHLRDGWLHKGLTAVAHDEFELSRPGAHHELGVGKNMLSAIRYWVQATGLVVAAGKRISGRVPLELSDFGRWVRAHDPFLEDPTTLWLAHVHLASNRELATFWHWAFNEWEDVQFTEDALVSGFARYAANQGFQGVNERSVRKDALVFLRTYRPGAGVTDFLEETLDCPFATLGLLQGRDSMRRYSFSIGRKENLPPSVVAYATRRYALSLHDRRDVLSIDELRWASGGPGRLLLLDTRSLTEALEDLEERTRGEWLQVDQTAGLRNVHLRATAMAQAQEGAFRI